MNYEIGDESLMGVFDEEENLVKKNYTEEDYNMIVNSINVPSVNSVSEAEYVDEDEHHFLLNANFKDVIRVPKNKDERRILETFEKGTNLNVLITGISDENNEYSIDGSVAQLYKQQAFNQLHEINEDEYVNVFVKELTPGGYMCDIKMEGCDVEAFLPQFLADVNKISDSEKEDLVGNIYKMCIDNYSRDKKTWIVSRRKYLEKLIPSYIDELDKHTEYTGYVTGTAPFGVFVQFNECLTGMIHSTNLNEEYSKKFEERNIKAGDEISFKVRDIIKRNKIILTQQDKATIWDRLNINQKIDVTIKDHKSIGTIVQIDEETTGLIHKSEENEKILDLEIGDVVKVKVLKMDADTRNIFLGVI